MGGRCIPGELVALLTSPLTRLVSDNIWRAGILPSGLELLKWSGERPPKIEYLVENNDKFMFTKMRNFFHTLPVGKAQETLGHVDQACRRMAALASSGGGDVPVPLEQGRLLVRFLWHLEQAGLEKIRV